MNKEVSERIFGIINSRPQIQTFTITGYRLMETKLVIHYHDCEEVYLFEELSDGEVRLTKGFTADHKDDEYLTQVKHFAALHKKCQPEDLA
jgi:hypothetical protein